MGAEAVMAAEAAIMVVADATRMSAAEVATTAVGVTAAEGVATGAEAAAAAAAVAAAVGGGAAAAAAAAAVGEAVGA
jgi:hypothetical protein